MFRHGLTPQVAPVRLHMFSFTVAGSPIGADPYTPDTCTLYSDVEDKDNYIKHRLEISLWSFLRSSTPSVRERKEHYRKSAMLLTWLFNVKANVLGIIDISMDKGSHSFEMTKLF